MITSVTANVLRNEVYHLNVHVMPRIHRSYEANTFFRRRFASGGVGAGDSNSRNARAPPSRLGERCGGCGDAPLCRNHYSTWTWRLKSIFQRLPPVWPFKNILLVPRYPAARDQTSFRFPARAASNWCTRLIDTPRRSAQARFKSSG